MAWLHLKREWDRRWMQQPPAYEAALAGDLSRLTELLTESDLHGTAGCGRTLLHCAAQEGHVEVIDFLLRQGASLECDTWNGWSPLMAAVGFGHKPAAEFLLQAGANVDAVDIDGHSAVPGAPDEPRLDLYATLLMFATVLGFDDIVELLLENGADTRARNVDGRMALSFASELGHLEAVKLLLYEDLSCVTIADSLGKSPLEYALDNEDVHVVEILEEYGAGNDESLQANDSGIVPLSMFLYRLLELLCHILKSLSKWATRKVSLLKEG